MKLQMHEMRLLSVAEVRRSLQKELGNRIRAARNRQGLSQSKLASLAGLHVSHLSKIERGGANLTFASLLAIAIALEMDLFEPLRSISLPDLTQAQPADQVPTAQLTIPAKDLHHGA